MTDIPIEAKMVEATLTDEMIASMKEKIGLDLRIDHSIFNEEATRIAILKFAAGIGDINPLWIDAEYATKTSYGGIAAPPSFVIGVFSGLQFGWPGLGSAPCFSRGKRSKCLTSWRNWKSSERGFVSSSSTRS